MNTDRQMEALFARGAESYARQLACQLERREEKFSPPFEAAMEQMIREQSRRAPTRPGWKRQLKAAGLALVCLVGLGLGAMRVEAIRIPLMEFLVGEEGSYTQVQFPSLEDNPSFRGEAADYLPTWVPQGFRLESVSEDSRFLHAVYVGSDGGQLFLTATPSSGSSVMLDRQGAVVTQTEIGTRGAFIARRESDDRLVVLMFDNSYAYTLTGYLSQDDATALMKSIPGPAAA